MRSSRPQRSLRQMSQAEGDLLTNLVCYSHSGGSIPLPPGYVPLPDNLYTSAIKEIAATFPYTESGCDGKVPALPSTRAKATAGAGILAEEDLQTRRPHDRSGRTREDNPQE